jgi:PAS domain S-box-containing protein
MDIASFFWYILSAFTISLILLFIHLFFTDRDLRKIMFSLGLLPTVFTFVYLGIHFPPPLEHDTSILFFLYRWGTIPLIECFFFILLDQLIYRKKEFKYPFMTFLFFYVLSFICVFLNILPDVIFYSSLQVGTAISIIFCLIIIIKERTIASWLFLLSICCFTISGMSLLNYVKQTENFSNTMLAMFSFFLAYIFLALIFGLSKISQKSTGLELYFSLEKKLKATEDALYNTEQRYHRLVENINEGIWVLNSNSQTTYVNTYMAKMLGYLPDEMIGKNFFDVIEKTQKRILQEKLSNLKEIKKTSLEFDFIKKDRTLCTASLRISPGDETKKSSQSMIIAFQDITEQKKMEHDLGVKLDRLQKSELATLNIMEDLQNTITALTVAEAQIRDKNKELQTINTELISAREELTNLNRDLEKKVKERTSDVEKLLQQKDEFVSQLGHDLKTPLTPLNILIPIVKEQEQDPKLKELLTVISHNVQYMKNLVIKTLELAQLNSSKMTFEFQDIDLTTYLCDIIDMEKVLVQEKDVIFENNIPQKTIVKADYVQIKELFDNLISNAIKYSKDNSVKITFDAQQKEGFIVIAVKDTGIGLEANQIPHIFDEFYKVDYSRHDLQSTGLGLTICKKIIEKHGGEIWVESPGKGKGSTFFFTLKTPDTTSGTSS